MFVCVVTIIFCFHETSYNPNNTTTTLTHNISIRTTTADPSPNFIIGCPLPVESEETTSFFFGCTSVRVVVSRGESPKSAFRRYVSTVVEPRQSHKV